MVEQLWLEPLLHWFERHYLKLIWSAVIVFLYVVLTRLALPRIEKGVDKSNLKSETTAKAYHTVRLLSALITIAILLIIWGLNIDGLLVISTSLITLTGVALFATWSILSNITSYFVLLFHNSFRRGNFVRIIDADNYIEGYISEVNLFNVKLITEEREVVVYPNNLIIGRPTIINPRGHWKSMGKLTDKPTNEPVLEDTK